MKTEIQLLKKFLKIGVFTFGGGYGMIPLVKREIVEETGWLTNEELVEMLAVSESTPGSVAVNIATFVGYRIKGFWGALLSTIGVVMPSFVIIIFISYFLEAFSTNPIIRYAFWGIRVGILALMLNALFTVYSHCQKSIFSYILMAAAFLMVAAGVNAIPVLILCGAGGILFSLKGKRKNGKKEAGK